MLGKNVIRVNKEWLKTCLSMDNKSIKRCIKIMIESTYWRK